MMSFTSDDARRRFGEVMKLAGTRPVEITRYGRRQRFVLLSAGDFEALCTIVRAHEEERVVATVTSALDLISRGDNDEEGFRRLRRGSAMMKRLLDAEKAERKKRATPEPLDSDDEAHAG